MTIYLQQNAGSLSVDEGAMTVPGEDIIELRHTESGGRSNGEGKIVIDNSDPYPYTTGADQIDIGSRIDFTVSRSDIRGFGAGPFGEDAFGDFEIVGTYLVLDWDIIEQGAGDMEMVLTVGDYVFSILKNRTVFYQRSGVPVSGSENAALNTILREYAPEVDRSALPTIDLNIDYFTNGKTLDTVIDELAQYVAFASTPVIQASRQSALIFEPFDNIDPIYDEPPEEAFGMWGTASESGNMANRVRGSGGRDVEDNIDDEQLDSSGTFTVSNDNKLWTQVSTRKSELPEIEVYTKGGNQTDDGPRVRLQVGNDTNDGPIAPNDTDSDIVSTGVRAVALDPDGWTSFNMGQHVIPERNPWLIIDTSGNTGYEIGVDGTDTPAYKAHFSKPLVAEVSDRRSINEHIRMDTHFQNDSLVTRTAVRDKIYATLERHAWPDVIVGPVECVSDQAHALNIGDVIPVDRPEMRAAGDFIVTKKESTYAGNQLNEKVELRGTDTYA